MVGMKPPTIYDVAERAGVSKSLVSLVMRGSPRVSDEKRAAVLHAAAELNYTPSRLAAGLAGTRTRSVGVIIDDFANLWFVDALAGLRAALADGGYALSVADARLNAHLDTDPVEAFRAQRVDGLVVAGEADPEAVARSGIPAVVLGVREAPGELAVIASDEELGGELATRHLIELGHRRIACVAAPGASAAARRRGYEAAVRAAGIAPVVVHAARTDEATARAAVATLLGAEAHARPSAVFAVNDPMAVGVIGAGWAAGLRVPRDLSVVGYDDSPLAAYGMVALTSVSGDPRMLGEVAGRRIAALLDGGAAASWVHTPQLVLRDSTTTG